MQGRPERGNDAWRRETSEHTRLDELLASKQRTGPHRPISTETGKHRIPQPPPNRPHVASRPDTRHVGRPDTPRVPRPERQGPPKRLGPFLLVLGGIVAIIIIIIVVIMSVLASAISQSGGSALTASDFINSFSTTPPDYTIAYQDLTTGVKLRITQSDFTKQATALDQQYGQVTNFDEIENSATPGNANTISYTYNITRAKNPNKPYKVTITLYQDPNNQGWKIDNYGTILQAPPQ